MMKTLILLIVGCLLLGCTNQTVENIEKRIKVCNNFPADSNSFSSSFLKLNEFPMDSMLANTDISTVEKECLSKLNASYIMLLTEAGEPAGYLFYFKDNKYILHRSFSGKPLSRRYQIKRKMSPDLYIVEFRG